MTTGSDADRSELNRHNAIRGNITRGIPGLYGVDLKELREAIEANGMRAAARQFGVNQSTVWRAARNNGWAVRKREPIRFDQGNKAARTHGAFSEEKIVDKMDQMGEMFDAVRRAAPWLNDPAYAKTVEAWMRVEAQVELLTDYLDENGFLDDAGVPRPATKLLDRSEGRAASLRSKLGLDPDSRLRLMRQIAETSHIIDLGASALDEQGRSILREQGAQLRATREALESTRQELMAKTAEPAAAVSARGTGR